MNAHTLLKGSRPPSSHDRPGVVSTLCLFMYFFLKPNVIGTDLTTCRGAEGQA